MSESIILDDEGRLTLECEVCKGRYSRKESMSFVYSRGKLKTPISMTVEFHHIFGRQMRICGDCYHKIFDSLAGGEEDESKESTKTDNKGSDAS